ncbi:unnamed protein product [Paramecium sonneborni]|uniref:Uncharacterized protein n=1 Tax=Paramecium sonneborni TaxID=65129 RepID=A0A8S1NPA0_9CILI|nr:unnamed protein product [Paramecium sonneborni]
MFNQYFQRGSIIENERIKSEGNTINVSRSNSLMTDQKHKGCLQRINILIQELERMSEAQKMANEEIQNLQREITKLQKEGNPLNLLSQIDQQGKDEELRLEKQKFNQYKQIKEQQIIDFENELIRTHKELKEEKLMRLDLNHRFELKTQEVERLKQEIENFHNQQNFENEGEKLHQLHEEFIQLQSQNQQIQQGNMKFQLQIEKLLGKGSSIQKTKKQLLDTQINKQQSLEEALFPSAKISPIKKMNKTLTLEQKDPYYIKSLYQSNRLSINYPTQQNFNIETNEQEQENENSYEHQYHSNSKRKNQSKCNENTQRTISKQYNQFLFQ